MSKITEEYEGEIACRKGIMMLGAIYCAGAIVANVYSILDSTKQSVDFQDPAGSLAPNNLPPDAYLKKLELEGQ